jgi:hypothetical protein
MPKRKMMIIEGNVAKEKASRIKHIELIRYVREA